jgi:hypothetical protein
MQGATTGAESVMRDANAVHAVPEKGNLWGSVEGEAEGPIRR